MGKTLGESVQPGFSSYVILQFGEPWIQGPQYGVLGYHLTNMAIIRLYQFQTSRNWSKPIWAGIITTPPLTLFLW